MFKKLGVIGAAVAVLALLISSISPVSSGTTCNEETIRASEVFRDDDEGEFNFIDLNGPGETSGDYFVFSDGVFNREGTRRMGRVSGDFMWVEFGRNAGAEIDATFVLSQGMLTVEGFNEFRDDSPVLAITGGTGRYSNVSGTLEVGFASDRTLFTFKACV
ncbi:hypothetical protein BH20ACT23_BH20ACT23_03650 [soil metagenome]